MSTKIYSGFEVLGHSLETLLPLLQTLRSRLEDQATTLTARWTASRATALFDRAHFGLPAGWRDKVPMLYQGQSFLGAAAAELQERQRAISARKERDPSVDFSAELVLFPRQGRLLGMAFIDHPELEKNWEATSWRRSYGYWNNTEAPEDVTPSQWAARRKDWDEVFRHSSVPAQCGYVFNLLNPESFYPHPLPEDLLVQSLPDVGARANRLALDMYLREHPGALPEVAVPSDRLSLLMRALRKLEDSEPFKLWKEGFLLKLPQVGLEQLNATAPAAFIEQGLS